MKHRLRYYTLIVAMFLLGHNAKAQYVTIPDTTFVNWLASHGYAGCMNGNQLDTTCSAVLNATWMSCNAVSIRDLTGIQYFKNLLWLDCSNDSIYNISSWPNNLTYINCSYDNLDSLPSLPLNLDTLICNTNTSIGIYGIKSLPSLPAKLQYLDCSWNRLDSLPALPTGLVYLNCFQNESLRKLPALSDSLQTLICGYDSISILPQLPNNLIQLNCSGNDIDSLPQLPVSLGLLDCSSNNLAKLPPLPPLAFLWCDLNQIAVLPVLPSSLNLLSCGWNLLDSLPSLDTALTYLFCFHNQLTKLPLLPQNLTFLECGQNLLTNLPILPEFLEYLHCSDNYIVNIPIFPQSLTNINCVNNLLSELPPLPDSLGYLYCDSNTNLTCLPKLKRIENLSFNHTAITCIPNYGNVTNSTPLLSTIPLCDMHNPSICQPFWNISGQSYYDQNNDCQFDNIDVGTNYVKTQLYSNGNLIQQTFSGGEGFYSFDSVANGNYTVQVDTSDLPFTINCPDSNYYSVTLSAADSLSYSNDFAFKCRTAGFDLGIQSVINEYAIVRPNTTFTLNTIAGDMSELYGAHCAMGVSGNMQITYSGPITYLGPAPGALTPTLVSGNTIVWVVPDFGAVNDFAAFNLLFKIDSLAVPGTPICFSDTIGPFAGDYNLSNNTLSYCFPVVASLDPNEKEVYPAGNTDTSNHWLTYTIRFQNTGSANAVNIRITDTLDSNLDPSTFQLLAYSAKNLTQIFGNDVVFNFPNINLPDSATSDSASRGFVQYRIKLKDNLPVGTQIQNTADIYFDLNPAIVTNTTVNTITTPTGFTPFSTSGGEGLGLRLFPNPAKNYVIVETDENAIGGTLQITDITGRAIYQAIISNSKFRIPTSALTGGVYLVKVSDLNGRRGVGKLVVE
jgi:uncharacterized repeat protein (TIGR01451 family)